MQETWIQSLDWEDPLEGRACQPTLVFLAGEFPWTEEPGGHSPGSCRELDAAEWLSTHMHSTHDCCQSIIKASSLAKHLLALVREVLFLQNVFFFFSKYMPVEVITLFCSLIVTERRQRYAYLVFICRCGLWVSCHSVPGSMITLTC